MTHRRRDRDGWLGRLLRMETGRDRRLVWTLLACLAYLAAWLVWRYA